jgi:hypothetical protein
MWNEYHSIIIMVTIPQDVCPHGIIDRDSSEEFLDFILCYQAIPIQVE